RGRRGEFMDLFTELRRKGFARVRVDGEVHDLFSPPQLDRRRRHDVDLVVDRVRITPDARPRVAEAVDVALAMSEGDVVVATDREEIFLSRRFSCQQCGISVPEPTHASFSFNSPRGMCPECEGLGQTHVFDPERLVEYPDRSILDGAIPLLPSLRDPRRRHWFEGAARHYGFDLRTPWKKLKPEHQHVLMYGSGDEEIDFYFRHWKGWEWRHRGRFEGVINWLSWRYKQARSEGLRAWYEPYMNFGVCPSCKGRRLRPESLAVTIGGKSIADLVAMSVAEAREWFSSLKLSPVEEKIAEDALKEIRERLDFLVQVGLGYLTLDRTAPTLAGGEAQRLRLASQVGSGLSECLYVLDEPSIGLHPRDQGMLLDTLRALRDRDNTVIVVEHDEQTILAADWIVDFGPGAGHRGGRVVAQGTPADIRRADTPTGRYLSHRERIPVPRRRRQPDGRWLVVRGARQNNLQNLDVRFPIGLFTCVTGVSGSGKSSLVADTLYPALARALHRAEVQPGEHDSLEGLEHVDKVILVDQDPIGRTPRSNPATYVGVFDHIRAFYASLPESRARGFKPGRFSFNTPEGRCAACQGYGARRIESDFLADVWVPCEECNSSRYARETVAVTYRGKSIADVLDMEVAEAAEFFAHLPRIRRMLEVMRDVGLGYVKLGQPATTLSGGEAQRVKLAAELARPRTGRGVYILDEPTTGLHLDDVRQLLAVFQRFVEEGNTVLVVEHHPDVIKSADWIIDLGPEGGADGGRIVAEGPPEVVAHNDASHTGRLLRRVLAGLPAPPPGGRRRRVNRQPHAGYIQVHGAREHNLKKIHVRLPRRKLTVLSGVSGSGKTSLALDTLYAEGQRRFVESLSTYARQFVSQMPKPKVDRISGLPPAVALDQRGIPWNPRATVGTMTQVYDYLRVLYARIATPFCPKCDVEIATQTADRIVDRLLAELGGEQVMVLGPLRLSGQEDYPEAFSRLARQGWTRVRIDGEVVRLDAAPAISRRRRHQVEVVVDRVAVEPARRPRLAEAVEAAAKLSGGEVVATPLSGGEELRASLVYGCPRCGRAYEPLTPRHYSFNHPQGWCPTCLGLGIKVAPGQEWIADVEEAEGLVDPAANEKPCPTCGGGRIRMDAAAARLEGRSIVELSLSPLGDVRDFFRRLSLSPAQRAVTSEVLGEIQSRLDFLLDVGLDYLTLHRPGPTLSGGEAQRVRLASQLGGNLTGLLYVMDEPTIGTHPRDVDRMLRVLRRLRDTGNTLLVVEHDPQTLRSADHVVDFGPGAGPQGGRVVARGGPTQLARANASLTGRFLAGSLTVPVPESRRITPAEDQGAGFSFPGGCLVVEGCAQHNLRDITVSFPLNALICVTGPSGSGKSTLVGDILYPAL
ncbi:MAG: excinuclease ABC subunit UvrA, partial [Armatimonadetes bacterium]|nr:excinuclease ABC subunit UvrA [Armatimonadota bacterium]